MKAKTYKSDVLQSVHEGIEGLYEIGLVDKATMHRFDESCLTSIAEFSPDDIKDLREREALSQAVLARYLNVTVSLVSKWERGEKKPSGPSLKLLSLARARGIEAIR